MENKTKKSRTRDLKNNTHCTCLLSLILYCGCCHHHHCCSIALVFVAVVRLVIGAAVVAVIVFSLSAHSISLFSLTYLVTMEELQRLSQCFASLSPDDTINFLQFEQLFYDFAPWWPYSLDEIFKVMQAGERRKFVKLLYS